MIDVVMPQMGESIVEGTLTKWLKKAGERVERDESLFEISTDKVDTEIPAPSAGVLAEVLVEEGKTVAINTVVARIDEKGAAAASAPPVSASPPPPAAPPPTPPVAPSPQPQVAPSPTPPVARILPLPQVSPAPTPPVAEPAAAEPSDEELGPPVAAGAQDGPRVQHRSAERSRETGAGGAGSPSRMWRHTSRRKLLRPPLRLPLPLSPCLPLPPPPCPLRPRPCPPIARTEAPKGARRTHEHHAVQDRRAHDTEPAHFRARHHGPPHRPDQRWRAFAIGTRRR